MDPCYKERCWAEFSINEGTRVCSRHFGEKDFDKISASMLCFSFPLFSGKAKSDIIVDVASSQIISLHSVEESTASLASDAFFCDIVIAVKRGVGGARFRGELRYSSCSGAAIKSR